MTVKLTKVSRALMRRSLRLLDMEYKPSEVAHELASSPDYIRRMITAGAPARKDNEGRYWIHGESFAQWLTDSMPKNDRDLKARPSMAENEAYCLQCRKITTYTEHRRAGRVSFGKCPQGHKTTRFLSMKPTGKTRTKGQ